MFSLTFRCHDLEAMSRQNFIGKNILVHLFSFSCDRRSFFVHLTLFLSRKTNLGAASIQKSVTRAPGLVILAAI